MMGGMIMKDNWAVKWPLFLLLLLLTSGLKAQEVTARLDLDRRSPKPQFIEYVSADKGLVTFGAMSRKSSRYLGVNKYDALFNKEWSKQVLIQNGRAAVDLVSVLGENIFVFFSEYVPRKRKIETSYSHFDLEGNILAERELISELPNAKELRVDLKFAQSINKKKLVCYRNLDNASKRETLIYNLFDAESDEIIDGKIEIPYPDDKFQVRKVVVSNSGNIYVMGKFYLENRIKTPDDFGFTLYRFKPGESMGEKVDIELGELYITDLALKVDRDENIFLAGFFSHRSTEAIGGTVFYRLSKQLELEVQSAQRFNEDFFNRFLNDRQIEKGREIEDFYLDNIVLRSDGGVLLIAEKYYSSYNSYMDMYGYWIDQRIHHYDDVIVNSVAANGDLEWSAVAQKRQSSEYRETLSYLDVVSGASLFLIYGDQPRRAPRTLYFNEITLDGEVIPRERLLGSPSVDDSFYPRLSEQISNYEALLVYFQEKEKIYSVVKVEF